MTVHVMAVPVLAEALVRWQYAAGPFWPYVCAAPFLGTGDAETLARQARSRPPHAPEQQAPKPTRRPVHRASRTAIDLANRLLSAADLANRLPGEADLASRLPGEADLASRLPGVAEGPQPPPALPPLRAGEAVGIPGPHGSLAGRGSEVNPVVLLADLPPEPLLAAAPYLVERGWHVVPVIQRWIASPAVLPCRRLVERLLLGAWQARRPTSPRGAILIADGDRTGPTGYPATVPGRAFDNRYAYQICRFPSTDFLRAHGVERVQWVTNGARAAERPVRPDLAPYLEDLLRAGLAVDVLPWPP